MMAIKSDGKLVTMPTEQYNALAARVEDLEPVVRLYEHELAENTRLRDDISFLLNLVPGWAKDVPVGLCPTFYGTGSSEGDLVVKQRVDAIRDLKEKP